MSSHVPRPPYTDEELKSLYPKDLKLVQVQILLRHGERAPTSSRFENAGYTPFWPYCSIANRFKAEVMSKTDGSAWDELSFRRRTETFGPSDLPVAAAGPNGSITNICQLGELTDLGRSTTLALGERLRELYVHRLGFLPSSLTSADFVYLRASPYPRALESVQQSFYGLYPSSTRTSLTAPPIIIARNPAEETVYDNARNCKRLAMLAKAFEKRAIERWNDSDDLEYVNKKIGKWMPESSPRVKIDGQPRLSGIMDTINATLAHGPATRLPKEFYDEKVRQAIDKAVTDEWFSGYSDSEEYRRLGWGSMVGDIVSRMMGVVKHETSLSGRQLQQDKFEPVRLALSGAHDTTLSGFLSSYGGFYGEGWPRFTSHIAIELFRNAAQDQSSSASENARSAEGGSSWLSRLPFVGSTSSKNSTPMERKGIEDLSESDRQRLKDYYVRIRYNDRPITIPGCKIAGRHLDSNGVKDESFCTLEAFKAISDAFTPNDWKKECVDGLDKPLRVPRIETEREPAGYIPGDLPPPAASTAGATSE